MSEDINTCCYDWEKAYELSFKQIKTNRIYTFSFLIIFINMFWSMYMIDLYHNVKIDKNLSLDSPIIPNDYSDYNLTNTSDVNQEYIKDPYFESSDYRTLRDTIFIFFSVHCVCLTFGLILFLCPISCMKFTNVMSILIYVMFGFAAQLTWILQSQTIKDEWKEKAYDYWFIYSCEFGYYWIMLSMCASLWLVSICGCKQNHADVITNLNINNGASDYAPVV